MPAATTILTVNLRQATSADDEFCWRLHEASMREYVEPVYGWDAFLQHTYHVEWFDPDRLSVIEDEDGEAIGVLEVIDEGDHLYLSRIEVLPEAQGHGIGTRVVGDLLTRGRTVRLHVFTNNVGARRFYERLGFTADRHADREHRLSMLHLGDTDAV
jgi:ribosomal protein S18 acetylase RimI-like enzyme